LVQPLVENAVQHAIRPQLSDGRQGRISVHFGLDGPSVCVKVVDNGGGFNPAEKSTKSHGLSILEERLDLLSKKHGGDFSLSFRQLGDEHSPNGMEVSLILSLENDV
jgi:LytS/YehU family sensor histidine kinase